MCLVGKEGDWVKNAFHNYEDTRRHSGAEWLAAMLPRAHMDLSLNNPHPA